MLELAPIDPKVVTATPKRATDERIPKRIRHACELLASGECRTIKAAAERVGMTREHVSKMLGRPHVQAFLERDARRTIAMGRMRASNRVLELLDAASEHVSLDAAKHVLAIGGIAPPTSSGISVNINNNIAAGYVIDLGASPASIDAQAAPSGPSND